MQGPTITRSAVSGTIAWAASWLAAVLYVAPNGWVGARDLAPMTLWSAPFAVVLSLAAALSVASARGRSVLWLYGSALLLGPALGFGCFALAAMVRGGWVVAFPVFSCWAYGGFLGLLYAATTTRSAKSIGAAVGLLLLASLALVWTHSALRRLG